MRDGGSIHNQEPLQPEGVLRVAAQQGDHTLRELSSRAYPSTPGRRPMGLRPFACTYSYPYAPECVEEEFCEVGLRVYGVLRSSSLESPRRLVRARDYSG